MGEPEMTDLFVIGGGVNGCGIARDAAGRGLSVTLAEQGDLAQGTSSASSKLFHGGLRYLEYLDFKLVREALAERELLLKAMPHIAWPMRFVLPYDPAMRFEKGSPVSKWLGRVAPWWRGRRPAWLIRLGLFLYDHMGGKHDLPRTERLDLLKGKASRKHESWGLKPQFHKGWEYSDAWVDDARLVVLNARDAAARGAQVLTRTKVVAAKRQGDHWEVTTEGPKGQAVHHAKALVNAAGPWVDAVTHGPLAHQGAAHVRLVRGAHIVTKKLFAHDRALFLQGPDGRIIFLLPFEQDFTLIGTTEAAQTTPPETAYCTEAEREYLINFANHYLETPISAEDVVWSFAGVRPLYDDGTASATAATRDYVLQLEAEGAPLLTIYGGKITTYRHLAQAAVDKLVTYFPKAQSAWTAGAPLPGGDFGYGARALTERIRVRYRFLGEARALRMAHAYGTEVFEVLGEANRAPDLGRDFGAGLTEVELRWLMAREWARTAEDVVWRRTKLGLRMTAEEIAALDEWMQQQI
ncbi:homodimeric glycerol 3-phosphate dehydrogenase (quinone) [Rhodobacter sp. JA431]|uniref:glycerol-3-phosphate dehydrogenase n=1 Tax=Rhodobacter sp. JA431 TaxID=570013 RepID=UPI000BD71101|nr:glycerol-3-phosphate dehydrogenase [Rhodobacter sp. JA431]SOC15702.1 homodimeric glycerol 3-phosphate dehydrogenase (quinone) [Rhodobacter sp. JA431]